MKTIIQLLFVVLCFAIGGIPFVVAFLFRFVQMGLGGGQQLFDDMGEYVKP